jgi:hypothetical protein
MILGSCHCGAINIMKAKTKEALGMGFGGVVGSVLYQAESGWASGCGSGSRDVYRDARRSGLAADSATAIEKGGFW